jgi:hypothetical protein
MKNIFLVMTPLQILIAIKIIKFSKIKKKNAVIIYYGYKSNNVIKKYLKKGKYFFYKIEFVRLKNFPFYLLQILKLKKKYNKKEINLYTTNVDTIINCYFLSFFKINNIYTFYDGSGDYETKRRRIWKISTNFKKVIYSILGNRYSLDKLKNEKKQHFIINDYFREQKGVNVGSLFKEIKKKKIATKDQKEINFYVGTVEEEYFADMKATEIEKKNYFKSILRFLKTKKNVIYLRHPRSTIIYKSIFFYKNQMRNCIAEEIILKYFKRNYKINIFGFYGSTVFYNLFKYKSINKYYFDFNKEHHLKLVSSNFFSKNFKKILIT